jgi:hypothetical protein
MDPDASSISQAIQLAVAPVFLLAGIGAFVNAFASRLGRIFDRIRQLEKDLKIADAELQVGISSELAMLTRRVRLAYIGIALGIVSALLVCVLIALVFAGYYFPLGFGVGNLTAALFVAAMLSLIGGLFAFLREISLAVRRLSLSRA